MATKKNNSINNEFTNNADGGEFKGGIVTRLLKWLGADITLTGSGTNTYTFPAATDTLVGRISVDTLDNKSFGLDTTPSVPPANSVGVFGRAKGTRMMLAQIGPAGIDTALQPFLGSNKCSLWSHGGNSTAITAPTLFLFNFVHVVGNAEGTVTARNVSYASNFLATARRLGYVTIAAANLSVGIRQLILQQARGNSTTLGGYFYVVRVGFNTADTGNRGFFGLSTNTAAFTVTADPSATGTASAAICTALGYDAADTNWQVFTRTATGSAMTKVDTGIPKPVDGKYYELAVFAPPNGSVVGFSITDLVTGASYSGSTSTTLPAVNTLMSHRVWANTGSSTTILGLDTITMYVEVDN